METLRLHSHRCCFAFHRNGDAQRFAGKLKPSFDQFVQNLRFFSIAALGRNWIERMWSGRDGLGLMGRQYGSNNYSAGNDHCFGELISAIFTRITVNATFSVEMLVRRILKCPQLHFSLVFPLS